MFGYRKLSGPMNKITPWIIMISSILIVTLVTLVAIPLLSLAHEGFPATIENLNILYQTPEYMSGLLKDLVISIVFTILGASIIFSRVKQEIA